MNFNIFLNEHFGIFVESVARDLEKNTQNLEISSPIRLAYNKLSKSIFKYEAKKVIEKEDKLEQEEYNIIIYLSNIYKEHLLAEHSIAIFLKDELGIQHSPDFYMELISKISELKKIIIIKLHK